MYTYTVGITYNSITTNQMTTFTMSGPTPTPPPTGPETINVDYTYDPLYRLTRATYTGSFPKSYAYSYDAVGNRQTQNANGTLTSYSYDHANRLTSVNGQPYTWDANGNLLSDGLLTYSYDQANRLKQVTQGANTYTFAYNGVGDRLSQTVGVTTTRYVLDPAAGLTQVLSDGTNAYLYGNGRLAHYQAAMRYFGADGLGSVRQLYDASGQVLATNRYDPYGSVMSHSGSATSVFGFTGEQYDAATGLEYLRARYYSAAQGRFTTRDVWEGDYYAPLSLNKWSYAQGNPVSLTDPSGHDAGAPDAVDPGLWIVSWLKRNREKVVQAADRHNLEPLHLAGVLYLENNTALFSAFDSSAETSTSLNSKLVAAGQPPAVANWDLRSLLWYIINSITPSLDSNPDATFMGKRVDSRTMGLGGIKPSAAATIEDLGLLCDPSTGEKANFPSARQSDQAKDRLLSRLLDFYWSTEYLAAHLDSARQANGWPDEVSKTDAHSEAAMRAMTIYHYNVDSFSGIGNDNSEASRVWLKVKGYMSQLRVLW